MELTNLGTDAERVAASRSRLYQLLIAAFAFPDEEFYGTVRDGSFAQLVDDVRGTLPYDLGALQAFGPAGVGESYPELESEYIRLFDVGTAGPPCPLNGGAYVGDRMKVMEDATRFYNFFQLHLASGMRALPDHITTELEFLHYLTFREVEARQSGADPASLLRAERDFLKRHLCRWMPRLQERLAKQSTLPYFARLVDFATKFFEADRTWVAAACGT